MKSPSPHRARWMALFLMLCFVAPSIAQSSSPLPAPASATPQATEDLQPKFIWGILINIAIRQVMPTFTAWLKTKVSNDLSNPSILSKLLNNSSSVLVVPLNLLVSLAFKSAGALENTVVGEPTKPMTVEAGRENYQAVHVAIVGFDRSGSVTDIQPVTAGFQTGDRIKIKVLPTFDGLLVIENINPQGKRVQIFPPRASDVIAVKAGVEILVPMAKDDYFEFAGVTGEEQLVITIRDARAFGAAASKVEVNRKDDKNGSSFVQETAPGTYPVISQSLKLKHDKASEPAKEPAPLRSIRG
jgi:Domain of unknown function (DUF4384)